MRESDSAEPREACSVRFVYSRRVYSSVRCVCARTAPLVPWNILAPSCSLGSLAAELISRGYTTVVARRALLFLRLYFSTALVPPDVYVYRMKIQRILVSLFTSFSSSYYAPWFSPTPIYVNLTSLYRKRICPYRQRNTIESISQFDCPMESQRHAIPPRKF